MSVVNNLHDTLANGQFAISHSKVLHFTMVKVYLCQTCDLLRHTIEERRYYEWVYYIGLP